VHRNNENGCTDMAKTSYFATDANGNIHTRNSDRVYTHTVVYRNSKSKQLEAAKSAECRKMDGRNYDYAVECAAGTHQHVTTITPASGFHASYTAEYIADRQEAQRAENEIRIARAKADIGTMTRVEYQDAKEANRVAKVEATDFTIWHNAGWCGRLDLAQKLAAKYNDFEILPATAK
jgi:hypothetical protein